MAIVERGNVVLRIADDDIQRYLDKGYSVTDGHGNVLKQAIPNDIGELHRLVIKQQSEIESLNAKIKELTEKSFKPKKSKKVEE